MHTPLEIHEKALELCASIEPASHPQFIDVTPEPGCKAADCFENIRRKVERNGGQIQYGWALWEWPGVFIEAEHHAVYVSPECELRDLTPCRLGSASRLFLADDNATYDFQNEGVRRDNIRLALADDPDIEELFKAARRRSAFYNDLPGVGQVAIHASEDKALQKIERRLNRVMTTLTERYGK